MAFTEQPFDEREERYFLTEILKASTVSPFDILRLVQETAIIPRWTEMALPQGRSVSACQTAYEHLIRRATPFAAQFQPGLPSERLPSTTKPRNKRPAPGEGPPTPADRTIQAQPFATVNTPGEPTTTYQVSPLMSGEPPHKKRGRPNKEEHERRVREAAARGEVYPPPRKTKTPRQSLEGGSDPAMAAAGTAEPGAAEDGSAGKKKSKKAKGTGNATHLAPEIPARISSLEATAKAAEQVSKDAERTFKSTIPETQVSEFPAQESLLAGMREHAAAMDADTMQSSMTLKNESAPRGDSEDFSPPTLQPPATFEPTSN